MSPASSDLNLQRFALLFHLREQLFHCHLRNIARSAVVAVGPSIYNAEPSSDLWFLVPLPGARSRAFHDLCDAVTACRAAGLSLSEVQELLDDYASRRNPESTPPRRPAALPRLRDCCSTVR